MICGIRETWERPVLFVLYVSSCTLPIAVHTGYDQMDQNIPKLCISRVTRRVILLSGLPLLCVHARQFLCHRGVSASLLNHEHVFECAPVCSYFSKRRDLVFFTVFCERHPSAYETLPHQQTTPHL
jgi:hypothetical protein